MAGPDLQVGLCQFRTTLSHLVLDHALGFEDTRNLSNSSHSTQTLNRSELTKSLNKTIDSAF